MYAFRIFHLSHFFQSIRLALLWFYTFGTQLFRNEDGYSKEKIDAVANLLDENRALYHQSAIFLFFHGRLERMKVRIHCFIFMITDLHVLIVYRKPYIVNRSIGLFHNLSISYWRRRMLTRRWNTLSNRIALQLRMN